MLFVTFTIYRQVASDRRHTVPFVFPDWMACVTNRHSTNYKL